jgi:hypothetical protein
MADIEDVLGIRSCPMNWPIGLNGNYTGFMTGKQKPPISLQEIRPMEPKSWMLFQVLFPTPPSYPVWILKYWRA